MLFDPEEGLYVFEIILGYKIDGETEYTPSSLIQADEPEEAEEKILEHLDNLEIDQDFWIEEISDPFEIEEYAQDLEENDQEILPVLNDLTQEEFEDFLNQ